MQYLEPTGEQTTGFGTWERYSSGCYFTPFSSLSCLDSIYFPVASLPYCFSAVLHLLQTHSDYRAIRSVQMRELFIWSDERGNTSKLLAQSQSFSAHHDGAAAAQA
jgi:hypothetical protein